jgi:hypothetical protein
MTNALGTKAGVVAPNALTVNLVAAFLTVLLIGVFVVTARLLPHAVPLGRLEILWAVAGILTALTLHELAHALSLVVREKMPWQNFRFGFNWRQLVFYCHCKQPMTVRAYRTYALAPLLVLGSVTVLATLAYPAVWLALTTAVHLAGCIGDVWMFLSFRRYPDHYFVLDFPDRIGGEVFEPASVNSPLAVQHP